MTFWEDVRPNSQKEPPFLGDQPAVWSPKNLIRLTSSRSHPFAVLKIKGNPPKKSATSFNSSPLKRYLPKRKGWLPNHPFFRGYSCHKLQGVKLPKNTWFEFQMMIFRFPCSGDGCRFHISFGCFLKHQSLQNHWILFQKE